MGVLQRIIFSHTPDEARSGGLVKACVPGKKLFYSRENREQFITLAILLVDEARYPIGQKDRMVCDSLLVFPMMLYVGGLSRKVLT